MTLTEAAIHALGEQRDSAERDLAEANRTIEDLNRELDQAYATAARYAVDLDKLSKAHYRLKISLESWSYEMTTGTGRTAIGPHFAAELRRRIKEAL